MAPSIPPATSDPDEPIVMHDDVHQYFGLTYANYLVLHRTLMQSMPDEWQHRMVACLHELDAAFEHVEKAEAYKVQPGFVRLVGDLTRAELWLSGCTRDFADQDAETGTVYHDEWATELDPEQEIVVPVRHDPIPHYQRGRTRVEPFGGTQ